MPDPITLLPAVIGAGATLFSSNAQSTAADTASTAQIQSDAAAIAEQRRQFNKVQELLSPYVESGQNALTEQMNILGLNGTREQAGAVNAIESSPLFSSLVKSGEGAILQNASATGGLRGSDTQGFLAQFRPQMLDDLVSRRFARLGGLAGAGQSSAAGVGSAGMQTGGAISQLLQSQGAARAGNSLAQGNIQANAFGNISNSIGQFFGSIPRKTLSKF